MQASEPEKAIGLSRFPDELHLISPIPPWFAPTGDTLSVGAAGRPDLPGRPRQNAAELHSSLSGELLPLAETVEVYAAHFSDSVRGAGLSGKPMTALSFGGARW